MAINASKLPDRLRALHEPFLALAAECAQVTPETAGEFSVGGRTYAIPRVTLRGPTTNVPQKRVGFFALVHGDEPAGAFALLRFAADFAAQPEIAAGYDVLLYPICNPTGYEDGTRHSRAGVDLNRLFWCASAEPEVRILETELRMRRFDGVVALHADDTSDGLYGYAHGRELNADLLVPALRASERVIPCNHGPVIDGFAARSGVIDACFAGVMRPPPELHPQPFEIIFETPGSAPLELQAEAARVAVECILTEYRKFIAFAQNL